MPKLILEKDIHMPGWFGLWDWKEDDWKKPIVFPNAKGQTYILLKEETYKSEPSTKRAMPHSGVFGIQIDSPTQDTIRALTSKTDSSSRFAEEVFSLFDETMRRMESVLRTTAGLKELYWHHHETLTSFFKRGIYPVNWWHGKNSGSFAPKLKTGRRRLAETYQKKNLIDPAKWSKLQKAVFEDDPPSDAVLELLRIRSRIVYRDRALPLIEAAIVTERTIRAFVISRLEEQGMSKKRIKELNNDLTFSLNSNVFVPLCLTRTEAGRLEKHIEGVNRLRKLRNDIAHANIGYDDVSYDDAKVAVDSALVVVRFIEAKLPENT